MESFTLLAEADDHIETPGYCDQELVTPFEGMATSFGATRNVVQIEHSFNFIGEGPLPLDEGEIAALIGDLWEFDDSTPFSLGFRV